jgi:hypothetical protein
LFKDHALLFKDHAPYHIDVQKTQYRNSKTRKTQKHINEQEKKIKTQYRNSKTRKTQKRTNEQEKKI